MYGLKKPWPPASSWWVQEWIPHQICANQILLPRDLEWGIATVGQCGGKSWEIILLQGKGGHCSLCKKKQRKLKRETKEREAKPHSYQTVNMNKKKNERQNNNKHPLCFPVVFWFLILFPQETWLYLSPWSLRQLGVLRTNPLFLPKLIWKDFCYFSNKKDQIKNKQRKTGETFMPIKNPLDTQRKKKITLLLKSIKETWIQRNLVGKKSGGISSS